MNRTLLVSLIKKNIDELILLTEGFETMSEYPPAIIMLAKNKTDDIKAYIDQLGAIQNVITTPAANIAEAPPALIEAETNETSKEEEVEESIVEDDDKEDEVDELDEVELVEAYEGIEDIEDIEDIQPIEDIEPVEEKKETIHASYIPEEIEKPAISDNFIVEKKITIAEKLAAQTLTRNEFHAKKENSAVNDTIAHKKVEDIRQAISLGDRFRFQRELFHNNGEEMNKMLSYINLLASYNEIVSFLQSKYGWSEDNSTANDFYQLIKRKF